MLIQIAQFLLGLSLLIVIHEFGHFLPAKYFGIKVSKFYLFFDYKFSLLKSKSVKLSGALVGSHLEVT